MPFEKLIKNEEKVHQFVESSLTTDSSKILTYFNQHCFNIYYSNTSYKKLIDAEFEYYLDGIGIHLALKLFGFWNVKKFNATDLNNILFKQFSEYKTKLFLIGGKFSPEFLENNGIYKLNTCGYRNGYIGEDEFDDLINDINSSSCKVIIIGMGVPKQELLAFNLSKRVKVGLIICVGNFLEFYFGAKKRISKIFRNTGVEWLYRLISEPRRLWKRYLFGIPLFFFRILRLRIKKNSIETAK